MPIQQARHWDSIESDVFEPTKDVSSVPSLERIQKQWLSELSFTVEHECQSILYAKSLLDDGFDTPPPVSHTPNRIYVGDSRSYSLNGSISELQPPPKPQRRIAQLKSSRNDQTMPTRITVPSHSTLDLLEACRFKDSFASSSQPCKAMSHASLFTDKPALFTDNKPTAFAIPQPQNWTPPGLRSRTDSAATLHNQHKPAPPSYDQLRIQVQRNGSSRVVLNGRRVALRHTIAVNQEDVDVATRQLNEQRSSLDLHSSGLASNDAQPPSPKSMHSDSTLSVDSGQCSGDVALTSQHSFSSREDKEVPDGNTAVFRVFQQRSLPSYARMASTMDHVLRTASSLYSLLSSKLHASSSRDLLAKTSVFMQIVETSPCSQHLPKNDMNAVRQQMSEMQREADEDGRAVSISNYFTILLRKMVEQVLLIFTKIVAKYVQDCSNKDRLLVIALEHLIHLALFGDELCIETIQCGGVHSLLKLIRQETTPSDTRRLLLRALAVLCGTSKGCLLLLSLDGLETVLINLQSSSTKCSIEAAGVLTQLTNPQHSFVQLPDVESIISRMLDLIDVCHCGESLLLVSAALSNVTLQHHTAVDILFKKNAISRLLCAYNREDCATLFVQEQLVTIVSRLAARRYEEALVSNGAVPMLLEMLTVTDAIHGEYCRRIRYKAAVCIGTLASTAVGLNALHAHQGYAIVCNVLQMESSVGNPLHMIIQTIKNRLESKHQIESAV